MLNTSDLTANPELQSIGLKPYISMTYANCLRTQEAYNTAVTCLFSHLDRVEKQLASSSGPYYFGSEITETDVRLFVTIIRFDPVYVGLFKCNIRDVRSGYPSIHQWLRRLYWDIHAFKDTTVFEQIKRHYMESLTIIIPSVSVVLLFCVKNRMR
jgi:glutathionyl-hydroquinone reductase